ncbi:hypothetical protein [Bacteroides ihuae]|uniref:hypothetical protein n=1 Tax=Bacteroides ihuae TaxID=1852362 RepID=UPI0008D9088A|nr:hypothetical protein [Bacteroides ihuae]
MKNSSKLATAFIGALLLFVACTPDNPQLGGVITESELNISVTQNPEKDNTIYLENKVPYILPYWDYVTGFSNKSKDTIDIRFAGEYEIKFFALDKGGSVSTSRKVTVSKNDEDYFKDPMWNLLTNGSEGKTWVWNDKAPAVFGNGGQGSTAPEWWQVPMSEVIASDWEVGDMVFDLNSAQNFTKTLTDGTVTKGFFDLDIVNKRVTLSGVNILHGADYTDDGANGNYYVITKLTETDLVLARQGSGWQNTWVFRKK